MKKISEQNHRGCTPSSPSASPGDPPRASPWPSPSPPCLLPFPSPPLSSPPGSPLSPAGRLTAGGPAARQAAGRPAAGAEQHGRHLGGGGLAAGCRPAHGRPRGGCLPPLSAEERGTPGNVVLGTVRRWGETGVVVPRDYKGRVSRCVLGDVVRHQAAAPGEFGWGGGGGGWIWDP